MNSSQSNSKRGCNAGLNGCAKAFTLTEMLVVIAIIGILAALSLPHLSGFGKSNSMMTATRQLLDDVALARQKALANRTAVYMVFVPAGFWAGTNATPFDDLKKVNGGAGYKDVTNLLSAQLTSYALLSLRSIGDQPGRSYAKYLSSWKHLPEGVIVAPDKFLKQIQILDPPPPATPQKTFDIAPFSSNHVYFPSVDNGTNTFSLPTIVFDALGQLASHQDEFIPLSRGSVFYARDNNGLPTLANADVAETPVGNATNIYNVIHINWLTGRAKLEQQEIP